MDNYPEQSGSDGEPVAGYQAPPQNATPSDPNANPYQPQSNLAAPQYTPQNPVFTGNTPQQSGAPVTPTTPIAGGAADNNPSGGKDNGLKKRLMIAGGGGLILLIIIIVVVVLLASSNKPAPQKVENHKTTSQYTGGPDPATQSTLQDSDSAISHYIGSLNNNNDFPPDALSNDNLHLN